MAWIESHQSLLRHKKTNRAIALLKVNRYKFIGHLHALWWWALDNAPTGSLIDLMPEEIADAAGWDVARANDFVNALKSVGFIDGNDGSLVLHDFEQYAGRLNNLRVARAEAGRKGGLKSGETRAKQNEANGEAKNEANPRLLEANSEANEAPTNLTSPHQPTNQPRSSRANVRHALDLSADDIKAVQRKHPKAEINARWLEWVSWIEEEGKKGRDKMPDDKVAAFIGWLNKNDGQKTAAPVAAGAAR